MRCRRSCSKGRHNSWLLPSAKSGPANLTSSTASAISVRTAIMWLAPPRPHSKRTRHARVHEGVVVRLAGRLIRACHHGIGFALLDEVKESVTGKLLFDGLYLTGLISRACAGNQSAKSHSNSDGFHWLPPLLGRDTILIAGMIPYQFVPELPASQRVPTRLVVSNFDQFL